MCFVKCDCLNRQFANNDPTATLLNGRKNLIDLEAVALDETHPLSADSDNFEDEAEIDKLAAKISGTA